MIVPGKLKEGLRKTMKRFSKVIRCPELIFEPTASRIRRGVDKSVAFHISYFPISSTTKRFFLDGLKKLEQRSHKCAELRGEYVE
jgi:hypothetical protein